MELIYIIVCDVCEDMLEPLLRMDIVDFAAGKKAVEHCRSFGALMGAGKQVVLSPQGYSANGDFDQIIVGVKTAIFKIILQAFPKWNGIFNGLSDGRLGENLLSLRWLVGRIHYKLTPLSKNYYTIL